MFTAGYATRHNNSSGAKSDIQQCLRWPDTTRPDHPENCTSLLASIHPSGLVRLDHDLCCVQNLRATMRCPLLPRLLRVQSVQRHNLHPRIMVQAPRDCEADCRLYGNRPNWEYVRWRYDDCHERRVARTNRTSGLAVGLHHQYVQSWGAGSRMLIGIQME